MLGTLPPLRGLSSYCLELALSVAALMPVEFISFKRLYPAALYPGGDLRDDSTFPGIGHPGLQARRRLAWYNPLSWLLEAFGCRAGLLHVQWWSLPLFPVYMVICAGFKLRRKPVVMTVHNVLAHDGSFFFQKLSRLLFMLSDHFIVHTPVNKRQLERIYHIPAGQITVIPHGALDFHVNPDADRNRIRSEMGLDHHQVVLLFGAIRAYKGIDTLLAAFARVVAELPDALLVIAGKPWDRWEPYAERIAGLKIKESVRLQLAYIPAGEVYRYFTAADLVVLPYHHFDSQSGVGAIALSFRKPMVVTDVGGLPDLVADRRFVVAPKNPAALAEAMIDALDAPGRLASMAAGTRQLAARHAWSAIARSTAAIYRNLTKKGLQPDRGSRP